jgi:hypothetical protein
MIFGMRLVGLLMLVPALGFADKTFLDAKGTTWDCKDDPIVSIQGNEGTFTFTGPCKKITVNGNKNTVHVTAADRVTINGNTNTVNATALVTLSVNGNDNTVRAKGAKASNSGSRNTVTTK